MQVIQLKEAKREGVKDAIEDLPNTKNYYDSHWKLINVWRETTTSPRF